MYVHHLQGVFSYEKTPAWSKESYKGCVTKLFERVHKRKVYIHLLVSTPYRVRLMYDRGVNRIDTAKCASHKE